jgi:GNAT superfamily N-acetyltransferase
VALRSTARNGSVSRIVPCLKQGAGVVTCRSDVRYVVTEYGIAYLHGKSIRERTLALIQVAHPKFRPWLLSEAKTRNLVYRDQIELPINAPIYPESLERDVELKTGTRVFLRPLRLTDEPLLREMFYKLSPDSVHSRFFRTFNALPHEKLQEFLRVDYLADMALVVTTGRAESARMLAVAHYSKEPRTNFAEASFLVRDDWQGKGIGHALMTALVDAARSRGIAGLTAEVLLANHSMLRVFHDCGLPVESELEGGVYHLRMPFTHRRAPRSKPAKRRGTSTRPSVAVAKPATAHAASPPA